MNRTLRLLKIYRVAVRYRLGELLDGTDRAKFLGLMLKLPVSSRAASRELSRGARLRRALEDKA